MDSNFTTARRLPAGEEMIIDRCWVYIPTCAGNTQAPLLDIKRVAENGYIKFQINRKDVAQGPLIMFPSGYGLVAATTENNAGVASIGVASTAAAARLRREQYVTSDHDLDAKFTLYDVTTWPTGTAGTPAMIATTVNMFIRAGFHGLVRSAATK